VIEIYIGIDDTDSIKGMCTTYLASEIISEFSECDVIGYPRLVRLNPNVPWKTRGNGAISIRLGKGLGKKFLIGEVQGKKYYGYEKGKEIRVNKIKKRVEDIVKSHAMFSDKNTNPAFVISETKPPQSLYWQGVRDIVKLNNVISILKDQNATYKGYKNKRGLIGASCAISWRPLDRTYEVITYRDKEKWGSERKIDIKSVKKMDKEFPRTFNNYDYKNKVVAISPNSPCPVLFGIRGFKPRELRKAMQTIKSEPKDRWILFETNQGTDEHLKKGRINEISKYTSVITTGVVSAPPRTIEGGHVIFSITDKKKIDCAAYEPTKEFRGLIRRLIPGDLVTVYGGVRSSPPTINIEKIRIKKLASVKKKKENPKCSKCGKRMKSMGFEAGYRCPECRTKLKETNVKKINQKREIKGGFYEVPVCARRHLSKPISRYNKKFKEN
jgi:tRNA(Ile2)-agmatinylcytidine synthase